MLKFGFKKEEKVKSGDIFPYPYLTVGVRPTEPKKTTRFKLSSNTRDLLEFDLRDNVISWLYDETDDKTFKLINITGVEADPQIDVTLDLTFSNKKLYEKLIQVLKLDETKEHYFELIKTTVYDLPAVKLVKIDLEAIDLSVAEEGRAVEAEIDTINEESKFENII